MDYSKQLSGVKEYDYPFKCFQFLVITNKKPL